MTNADVLKGQRDQVKADLIAHKAKLEGLDTPYALATIKAYEDKISDFDQQIEAEEAKNA